MLLGDEMQNYYPLVRNKGNNLESVLFHCSFVFMVVIKEIAHVAWSPNSTLCSASL